MEIAIILKRVFLFDEKGQTVILPDPEPSFSPEAVQNFYTNTYPILATATINGPIIEKDQIRYTFKTTVGTKG